MKQIKVYDVDFKNITDICEDNHIREWEVIAILFEIMMEEKIDISEWIQEV